MLSAQVIRLAKKIALQARKKTGSEITGQFLSTFRGEGLDLADFRPYIPGDDVRHIDWNISARMAHPYTKTFLEDRSTHMVIVLDIGETMRFGSIGESKLDIALELCGMLLLLGNHYRHKIHLLTVDPQMSLYLRPTGGKHATLRALSLVYDHAARHSGAGREVFDFIRRALRRKGTLFWISDFANTSDYPQIAELRRRFNLNLFGVFDRWELEGLPVLRRRGSHVVRALGGGPLVNPRLGDFESPGRRLQAVFPHESLALNTAVAWPEILLKYFHKKKIHEFRM